MLLKVSDLRKALENVDGNLTIATMLFAHNSELSCHGVKRFLLGESKHGEKFFIINTMGTHWDESWEKANDNIELKSYIEKGSNKIIKLYD